MKNFYVPNYERVAVDPESPQFVDGRYRTSWYKEFGFQVSFSDLEDNEIIKVLSKGFAPAVPIEDCATDHPYNYLCHVLRSGIMDIF